MATHGAPKHTALLIVAAVLFIGGVTSLFQWAWEPILRAPGDVVAELLNLLGLVAAAGLMLRS